MRRSFLALGLLFAAVGCGDTLGPQQDNLTAARNLFILTTSNDYTFDFQRSCFCPPETVRPMQIEVLDGVINSATYTDTSEPVTDLDNATTIAALFDEIQAAIDSEAFVLDATYDAVNGYPTSVSIDFIENAVDDEMSFVVTAFQPLDP